MYQARFNRLMNYLHEHLEEGVNLDDLCSEAGMSKYHFHRQFSAHLGMPVKTYANKMGLLKAAQRLAYHPQDAITDIAYNIGYQSPEAFSRAFKGIFGVSPSTFRQSPDWDELNKQLDMLQNRGTCMTDENTYHISLVQLQTIPIAIMEHKGPQHLLGPTLREFIDWRKAQKLPPSQFRTFNLLFDDPEEVAPEDYRFGLATQVPAKKVWPQANIRTSEIPAGLYARLSHTGPDNYMEPKVRWLYESWLPQSGYQPADFPMLMERKRFYPDVPAHQAETDLLLPLVG